MPDTRQMIIIATTAVVVIMMYCYFTGKYIKFMSKPFIDPTDKRYRMTSPFGTRKDPISGESKYHNGEDYAVPHGTELRSPADGTVRSVYSNSVGGLQVIIRHDNGFTTGYAHLSNAEVSKGQRVKQGDVFARTGNSGRSTGAHLHLTLRNPGNAYIAPSTYLYKD